MQSKQHVARQLSKAKMQFEQQQQQQHSSDSEDDKLPPTSTNQKQQQQVLYEDVPDELYTFENFQFLH